MRRGSKLFDLVSLGDFLNTTETRSNLIAAVRHLIAATVENWDSYATDAAF